MPTNRHLPNWLQTWAEIFDQTNIPDRYVIWSGIATIAAALQGRVWFDRGLRKIYPNLYVWLIGPPGSGKSIAAEWGVDLLRKVPDLNVHSGELTKTYLLKYLQASSMQNQLNQLSSPVQKVIGPSVILHSDELAASVGSGDMAIDLLKHLTAMYHVPKHYDYGTIAHSAILIENPLINWLACSTPAWLTRAIKPDIFDAGLAARVNTVVAPFPKKPPVDITIDENKLHSLLHDLILISILDGQFRLDPSAEKYRNSFSAQIHETRYKMSSETEQNVHGREEDHALKVAMILSAAVRDDLVIAENVLKNAFTIVNNARESSLYLYVAGSAPPKLQVKALVWRQVEKHGVITRQKLTQNLSWKAKTIEIDQALGELEDEKKIETIVVAGGHPVYRRVDEQQQQKQESA